MCCDGRNIRAEVLWMQPFKVSGTALAVMETKLWERSAGRHVL